MIYLRIAILAAFLAVASLALWYRGNALSAAAQAAQAKSDLTTALAANREQQATIERMRKSAELNDRLTAQMVSELAQITAAITETNEAVGDLADANEDVRSYLGIAVPDGLRLLLDK